MKKLASISLVLLFGTAMVSFAQMTSAPDQASSSVQATNAAAVSSASATNAEQTNVSSAAASAASVSSVVAVTTEKEVKAASGIVYEDGKAIYASPDVKFVLQASDEGSGVKAIHVMIDDSAFGKYGDPFGIETEGKHLIAYKVEDNVGNISAIKNYEFFLDKTAPEVTISSDKKVVKIGEVAYVGSNYNFGLAAQDNLSGVKSISYSMIEVSSNTNDTNISTNAEMTYDKPFAPIGANGLHKVIYKAVDNVGNVSADQSLVFFLDVNAPSVEFAIDPTPFEKDGVKYISANTLVKITAKDAETKVANVQYSLDDTAFVDYTYPIKLTAGKHTLKAKASDLVGNVSPEVSLDLTVDASQPEGEIVPTK